MAYEYFGLNFGQTEFNITQGTSALGTDVEVRVQQSNVPISGTNDDAIVKLKEIINYLSGKTTIIN